MSYKQNTQQGPEFILGTWEETLFLICVIIVSIVIIHIILCAHYNKHIFEQYIQKYFLKNVTTISTRRILLCTLRNENDTVFPSFYNIVDSAAVAVWHAYTPFFLIPHRQKYIKYDMTYHIHSCKLISIIHLRHIAITFIYS